MGDRRSGSGRPGRASSANSGHGVANLVGGGPSLVGPMGAMRARDVSRPLEADLARAQKTVVVRRRPLEVQTPHPPAEVVVDQSSAGASDPEDS
ncbi:MAG: hypothetical protein ABI912_08030 [Actinomycetota bacterium]